MTTQDRWDSLGFGVQPYDTLFEHSKLHGRVLDLGHFEPSSQVRPRVTLRPVDNIRTNKRIEEGFDSFTRKLKDDQKANVSLAGFKSSVSSHYGYENTKHTDYYFSRTASVMERANVQVSESTIPNLQTLVIPSVAKFLATNTPQQIFSVYGTHVTTGLVIGGELEFWCFSEESKFHSKEEFSRGVSASYKKLVQGSESASLSVEEEKLSNRIESEEGLVVRGGIFKAGPNGEKEWADSTAQNAQEIAYLPNGTVPIWLLIPNQEQANRVRMWYDRVYGPTAIILKRFSSPSLETVPKFIHPEAQIYVPDGWKVVSGGATVQYFGPGQLLTQCYPIVVNDMAVGWEVKSREHIESDAGKVQAHAIAIWDPFDSCDVTVRKATSELASHPAVSVKLPEGYTRVGGGAEVHGLRNLLVANYPVLEEEETWSVSSKDHVELSPCRIEAYVIGIRFRDGGAPKARVKSLTFGPLQQPFGTVRATEGYGIIGGGAQVSKGGAGNMLVSLVPSADGESFHADSKDHLRQDPQRLTVYAIEVEGAVLVNSISEVLGIDPTL